MSTAPRLTHPSPILGAMAMAESKSEWAALKSRVRIRMTPRLMNVPALSLLSRISVLRARLQASMESRSERPRSAAFEQSSANPPPITVTAALAPPAATRPITMPIAAKPNLMAGLPAFPLRDAVGGRARRHATRRKLRAAPRFCQFFDAFRRDLPYAEVPWPCGRADDGECWGNR